MNDQERLDLILAQARIAKAAMVLDADLTPEDIADNLQQAALAVEAIVLLADPAFNDHSNAA